MYIEQQRRRRMATRAAMRDAEEREGIDAERERIDKADELPVQ
jgi:hypothetical protein